MGAIVPEAPVLPALVEPVLEVEPVLPSVPKLLPEPEVADEWPSAW